MTSILHLPNELLREILSYVLANPALPQPQSPYDFFLTPTKRKISDSPVLAIRAVCHTFRAIADGMPFWYDKNFDLLSLIPSTCVTAQEAFLRSLFTDRCLVHALRLRTHWEFRSIGALCAVLVGVPSFIGNATSISLARFCLDQKELLKSPMVNVALNGLAKCRGIKSLDLGGSCHAVDLNILSNEYSQLENLSICSHVPNKGTLAGLSNIKKLRIWGRIDDASPNPLTILPLDSAATLTTLEIDIMPFPRATYQTTGLDAFLNLTTLHIMPLTITLCDFICRTNVHLLTFTTTVARGSDIPPSRIVNMLSANSLQNLQELNPAIQASIVLEPIIIAIVKISSLCRLNLEMGLDLRWHRRFSRLINLEELKWKLRETNS